MTLAWPSKWARPFMPGQRRAETQVQTSSNLILRQMACGMNSSQLQRSFNVGPRRPESDFLRFNSLVEWRLRYERDNTQNNP